MLCYKELGVIFYLERIDQEWIYSPVIHILHVFPYPQAQWGVALSFILGCILGGLSGYFGGNVDMIIQRIIEFLICIPTIPLWMVLTAALPIPLVVNQSLLCHRSHPLDCGLVWLSSGSERKVFRSKRRRFCYGGQDRWSKSRKDNCQTPSPLFFKLSHSKLDAVYTPYESRGDRFELFRLRASPSSGQLGSSFTRGPTSREYQSLSLALNSRYFCHYCPVGLQLIRRWPT